MALCSIADLEGGEGRARITFELEGWQAWVACEYLKRAVAEQDDNNLRPGLVMGDGRGMLRGNAFSSFSADRLMRMW